VIKLKERHTAPNKTIYDFYYKIYVKCPRCGAKAEINKKDKENFDLYSTEILFCDSCGFLKEGKMLFNSEELELWLQVQCCGNILWALNEGHLDYIENYIGAKLRERERDPELGWHNQNMASRLPGWMKDSKNRNEVLKGIHKLRKMI
jgi:hypothetical protein